ncbi:hypothetical protein JZK55_17030 [Dissulfurispira thermophila]|uniref:Uncharacterized protein n=1 Tax=Dissulfurispira thermophila TaxID=2715679 RepID=A0A7G1H3R3_9BACT|nr:hypothetical protein [Dissulfurispira thermophila]BCB96781.1 hypothetical protein JZK55_17030 [Dissulfurispira thermophila]
MGRTAKAYINSTIYTIKTDLYNRDKHRRWQYTNLAPELWDYMYPFYLVDEQGRLVYLYEGGLGMGAKSVQEDIFTIASDLHPSAEEKFDTVEIIDEDTGNVLKTLKNVDLIGILERIKEVMEG